MTSDSDSMFDYLVIGSGVAGLTFALKACRFGSVCVVSKTTLEECNTLYAQGGIAAVTTAEDSFEGHVEDTLRAGAGLCREEPVRVMVEGGPEAVRFLQGVGVDFSRQSGPSSAYELGREGGHSQRRVLHVADVTGQAIETGLLDACRQEERITLVPNHLAVDLLTASHHAEDAGQNRCLGAYVFNRDSGEILTVRARTTLLATGGAGKVYRYTTNPDVATGDGVAMAFRAGCRVANLEFFQFHPTCLFHPHAKSFLVTEAMRGEGGILRRGDGKAFMADYHPMEELAPRDVVARAIDQQMKERGDDCVFLDVTHKDGDFLRTRFPTIHRRCLELGIDITTDPIPVVPAAHYMCGGVVTDTHGRTDLPGLWAVGESTCTGVHGANRLASNSLLEGVVFATRAVVAATAWLEQHAEAALPEIPDWDASQAVPSDETVVVSHSWDEIRQFMWNYVGIFRSETRLRRALRRVEMTQQEIKDYYWKFILTSDLLELRNLALVAELIIRSALARRESRGLHYCTTWPDRDDDEWAHDTVLSLADLSS